VGIESLRVVFGVYKESQIKNGRMNNEEFFKGGDDE
jgi:hypothetical protein